MANQKRTARRKTRGFEESSQFSLFEHPPKIGSDVARSNSIYKIDLTARDLFGSDDAAYEDFSLLKSYSLERNEYEDFFDPKVPFFAIRAPKGTGKTTMVRLLEDELKKQLKTSAILKYDSEISPSLDADASLSDWIKAWKINISEAALLALSETSSFTFDPDMIHVIEQAEKRGQKRQNLIGLIRENFSIPHVSKTGSHQKDQEELLKRISPKKDHAVWIFLDEVDQFFSNDNKSIKKIGSMFLAARELTGYIGNLIIRITVKPNVFAVIENQIDSLSNLREHIFDLEWDNNSIRSLLAKRVDSYLDRNVSQRYDESLLHGESKEEREEWLISQIFFTQEFDLGRGNRPPHEVLGILADNRPRWVLSLCKISAKLAKKNNYELIHYKSHIKGRTLNKFGNNTITDMSAEYRCQCKSISAIINRFNGAPSRFLGYGHLIEYINNLIVNRMNVEIIGISKRATAEEVASFLYYIGFIDARKDISNKSKKHVHSYERPELMEVQFDDEYDEYYWEIRPTFREHLNLGRTPNNKIPRNRK